MDFIERIKNISIMDLAERMGYTPVRIGSHYYSLKEHDSVRIKPEVNAFWRNSTGKSGSVIDFAMEFGGYDRRGAIRELAKMYNIQNDGAGIQRTGNAPQGSGHKVTAAATAAARKPKVLELPPHGIDNKKVWRYLTLDRAIEPTVVRYFVAKGYLYQDVRGNCVFKTDKFGCLRSTGGKKFAIDVPGCDYDIGFFIRPNEDANVLIVAEGVIDIMSIMSQIAKEGGKYTDYSYLALSGVSKLPALFNHLRTDPRFFAVIIAMDNDTPGNIAADAAEERLCEIGFNGRYHKLIVPELPDGNDWNDYLKAVRGKPVEKAISPILDRLKGDF